MIVSRARMVRAGPNCYELEGSGCFIVKHFFLKGLSLEILYHVSNS